MRLSEAVDMAEKPWRHNLTLIVMAIQLLKDTIEVVGGHNEFRRALRRLEGEYLRRKY